MLKHDPSFRLLEVRNPSATECLEMGCKLIVPFVEALCLALTQQQPGCFAR